MDKNAIYKYTHTCIYVHTLSKAIFFMKAQELNSLMSKSSQSLRCRAQRHVLFNLQVNQMMIFENRKMKSNHLFLVSVFLLLLLFRKIEIKELK
jgi:hypothetical protein